MTHSQKQRQVAQTLVTFSGGRAPQKKYTWVDPITSLSIQQANRDFKIFKDILQRNVGPVGNILRRKDDNPITFYNEKIALHRPAFKIEI